MYRGIIPDTEWQGEGRGWLYHEETDKATSTWSSRSMSQWEAELPWTVWKEEHLTPVVVPSNPSSVWSWKNVRQTPAGGTLPTPELPPPNCLGRCQKQGSPRSWPSPEELWRPDDSSASRSSLWRGPGVGKGHEGNPEGVSVRRGL